MAGVQSLNANAEVMGRQAALFMNINAAKTNLGPKGTIKMLVSGAGGASKHIFIVHVVVRAAVRA
jgi:T-complex protein 1 subunit zeta